ncbi:MAG: hypothetical protein R2720_10755 [Candidatus Nanopelagicales bacterium]
MKATTIHSSIAILAVSVTALVGFAPAANAAKPAKTKVVILPESRSFYGYVKSRKLRCKDGRKIVLFQQLGSSPQPRTDQRVASDIAQANNDGYQWNMGNPGLEPGNHYYARATKVPGCKAANSVTMTAQE